mgnify:CR=1 FL=1
MTGWAITKRHRRNHDPVAPRSRRDEWLQDELYDNVLFGLANLMIAKRRLLALNGQVAP